MNEALEAKHVGEPLELIRAKGMVATKVGFLVSMVTPNDPDDPEKIAALKGAASALGMQL
jgi:hypothetical protein